MQLFLVVLALAAAAGIIVLRLRRGAKGGEKMLPSEGSAALAPGRQRSVDVVCREASKALRAHVALLAGEGDTLHLVGYAPRKPDFQLLDKVAALANLGRCIDISEGEEQAALAGKVNAVSLH